MESERQEIFWAVADVQAFLNAVENANKKANTLTPELQQVLKSWITCYTVIISAYETMQNEDNEAQNAVDSLLQSLGIAKFP